MSERQPEITKEDVQELGKLLDDLCDRQDRETMALCLNCGQAFGSSDHSHPHRCVPFNAGACEPLVWDWPELLHLCGSERRIYAAYWEGRLPIEAERFIEENVPRETIWSMKPICK